MDLPLSYITDKIYSYCHRPKYNKYRGVYNFECPHCREGKSKGKKRRGYFIIDGSYFCCHNCQQTWSSFEWIKKICNRTTQEIIAEAQEHEEWNPNDYFKTVKPEKRQIYTHTLPKDCINLTDETQTEFFKNNRVVQDCLAYIEARRLFTAVNKAQFYYTSLVDLVHKNRLIIPFFDGQNKIIFYQSRAIYEKDNQKAKYLSKIGANFSVFGVNNIDLDSEHIFLFEGPIDAMFIKNGVAVGGLHLNDYQNEQLNSYKLHKKIWVLDNQPENKHVKLKYKDLIEAGQKVFIWPKTLRQFKDLNELCIDNKIDQISKKFILKNTYEGMEALLRLK